MASDGAAKDAHCHPHRHALTTTGSALAFPSLPVSHLRAVQSASLQSLHPFLPSYPRLPYPQLLRPLLSRFRSLHAFGLSAVALPLSLLSRFRSLVLSCFRLPYYHALCLSARPVSPLSRFRPRCLPLHPSRFLPLPPTTSVTRFCSLKCHAFGPFLVMLSSLPYPHALL